MSIPDIIAAAREVYDKESSLVTTWRSGYKLSAIAVENFRATFDPTHVALMEAELQAGRHAWGFQHWPHAALAYNEARDALAAYRKERGL